MAQLSICLLGPFYVTTTDQTPVRFEYDKVRALLAYLAVESDRPIRREFLAGLFWPEQPEKAALNSLRQAILKLRQSIGDSGTPSSFLNISRESIQINPRSGLSLDVRALSALLEATEHHRHRNPQTCPSCAERRAQAVQLYRGDFLDQLSIGDCPVFETWIVIQREQLRSQVLQALTALTDYHLHRQEYAQAQQYAARQIEIDSLQEEAYRQMMSALALGGERIAALKWHEVCRQQLKIELDVEPDEETEKLFQLIRSGLYKAEPTGAKGDHSRLPPPPSPFFGRGSELAGIAELIEDPDVRLITLIGPGGVGKTSLALKAANEHQKAFAQGACFVPLAQLDSAEEIYRTIAGVLNLSFQGNVDYQTQLLNYLAQREMLIVLDNVEHLLPSATEKIHMLLSAAPQVVVILTSMALANLSYEYVFPVLGLEYPRARSRREGGSFSAVDLFLHCARQNGIAVPARDMAWIQRICRLVDGNPLAILLAAPLLRTQSCAEIAKGIQTGADLLTSSQADLPERQRSFRSLYDYAWGHLSEAEQSLLCRLSVFRGGFQREAAQEVAQASLTDLEGLLNKSFLRKNPSNRYRFHPMVRQYAHEKLTQADEIDLAAHLHLKYYVDFAQRAGPRLNQTQQTNWLKLLDRELGNLREAFQTAQAGGEGHAELALRLASALGRYWERRGYWREGQEWLTLALEMSEKESAIPASVKIQALFWAGHLASYLGQNALVGELAQAGLALCQQAPAPNNLGLMLILLGGLARNAGDYASARKNYQESLELFRKTGDLWGICASLNNLFRISYRLNAYTEATDLARQSLALAKEAGDQANISLALDFLGVVAHDQGEYEQGKAYLSESLAISRSIGARFMIGHAIYWLGRIARSQMKPDLASALFKESLAHYQEIGSKWGIAVSLQGLGVVEQDRENSVRAKELLTESLAVMQEVGDVQLLAYVKINLGEVALAKQEYGQACSDFRESLAALSEVKDRWLLALVMGDLARLAICQGQPDRAVTLIGIEEGIRKEIGTPRSPAEQAAMAQSMHTMRHQLAPAQFRKLRSQGMRMARRLPENLAELALQLPA